jgi:hypothetical protein
MARYPLARILREHGSNVSPGHFQDILENEFLRSYPPPEWSIDSLLCDPEEAIAYCDTIRRVAGFENFSNPLILHALLSRRKRGKQNR